jgi:hypothetical protein
MIGRFFSELSLKDPELLVYNFHGIIHGIMLSRNYYAEGSPMNRIIQKSIAVHSIGDTHSKSSHFSKQYTCITKSILSQRYNKHYFHSNRRLEISSDKCN